MSEVQWRPIPGYEGIYDVSSEGEIMSLSRQHPRGWMIGGHLLAAPLNVQGYRQVNLCRTGGSSIRLMHRLVMLAFIGPCPEGHEVLHGDGDSTNNRLSNLSYGTKSDNVRDTIKHGTHVNASKTHCIRGHAFTEANTYRSPGRGVRVCRTCRSLGQQRRSESRRRAA